jgi:hypothetical protein
MLSKLREILLTNYIGAILVALFVWQAVAETVGILLRSGFWFYANHRSQSVMGVYSSTPYPWDNLIYTAISVVLYLLLAYALARWLYPATSEANAAGDTLARDEQSQP